MRSIPPVLFQVLCLAAALVAGPTGVAAAAAVDAVEIHVALGGDDAGAGTAGAPLRTFAAAQRAARTVHGHPVTVLFHRGVHFLAEPITFTAVDSGTKTAPVVYRAAQDEEAVISGGQRLQVAWGPWKDGILKAKVPAGLVFDQLFIAGVRQPMARYPNFDASVAHLNGHAADAFSPQRAVRWKDPTGGYIHAMHASEWGDYHYRITGKRADGTLTMEGGWQNNRPGAMHDQYRMVENIFEELDAPGEWFLEAATSTLYCYPPPGIDLAAATIEVVRLPTLVSWRGDPAHPVRFVSLRGLTFRHAARTFMDNKEPLLRSDWTTYRGGALYLTGAEDCNVQDCAIDQAGGNAIFVSGYARRVSVMGCNIDRPGAGGISFIGDPQAVRNPLFHYEDNVPVDHLDLTPGPRTEDYPADCLVDDCLIHGCGRVEKQSAGVQIEMAARITIKDCSIYEMPRAGINIGDGCWGGHLIEGCDVFDTVLETGDHGSFNSWGRDRYWVADIHEVDRRVAGHPSLPLLDVVEPITLRNSRWRCDHGWDIDLDDGSSNYRIINNVALNGGIKLREGFNRVVENNIMVNNSLHPHVWYAVSHDVVRHNIVFTPYRPINMPKVWGDVCDGNLLYDPDAKLPIPASGLREFSGGDEHSLTGDARFIAPQSGDWRVARDSPALALGFIPFPTDRYGVRSPRLRGIARQPLMPGEGRGAQTAAGPFRDEVVSGWLGARIKNLVGLGEVSATGMAGESGVLVKAIDTDGALAKAGVREVDVIRAVNGKAVDSVADLLLAYAGHARGKHVTLGIWRTQQDLKLEIEGERGMVLSPSRAAFRGDGSQPSYDRDKDLLGSWGNIGVALVWQTSLPAGIYDAELIVAAPPNESGSTFRIALGEQHVDGVVPATKDWESFTASPVGTLTVGQTGACEIVLQALSRKGNGVMNLRALVLTRR